MSLPHFSIRRPVFTAMVFIAVIIFGAITLRMLPVEMYPNISYGHITINVDVRGGIPASEVEKSIAKPVEESVGSVSHLKNILSISKEGNAMIIIEFEPGTDMDYAALEVREKFNRVRNKLPREVEKPTIAKYEYTDRPVMILAVTSKMRTPEEIRKIVDEKIKDALQRTEGVARIEVAGGREEKIMVEVDKYRLQAFSLPINKVVDTISVNNVNLLAGEIKRKSDKYLVRTIGEFNNLREMEDLAISVTEKGSVVRIKDIAKVKDSYLDPTAFSRVNTEPSVSLYIQKESLANTVKVASLVLKTVEELLPKLDNDIEMTFTLNDAEYVKDSIRTVRSSLLLGGALAVIVLFLFLRDLPVLMAITFSIPISLMCTFVMMWWGKLTLNLMTLSGLALGVGMLVDNSIVVIENIYKKIEQIVHLRKNDEEKQLTLTKRIRAGVSAAGAEEVMLAISASTLTTIAVFLPLVYLNPSIRILYSGMSLTIIFALLASLVSALMLIPMFISRTRLKPQKSIKFFPLFENVLSKALKLRYIIFSIVAVLFVLSIHQAKKLEQEFIGIAEQNKFTVFIELPTGTRIDVTNDIVKKVENFINTLPEVKTVTAKVEPWSSKLYVELFSLAQRMEPTQAVIDKIRPYTEKMDPAFIYFEEEQEVGTKEIILEIFGYDYEVLKDLANQIGQKLASIPDFTDAKIRMREGRPEFRINIDKEQSSLLGFTVQDVALSLHTQLRGLVATQYRGKRGPLIKVADKEQGSSQPNYKLQTLALSNYDEGKETESIVRLEERFRKTFEQLKRSTIVNPEGEIIYLSQMADFYYDEGPSEIWRKNKARMVQVSANTGGVALGTAAELVKTSLADLDLPKDYFWEIGGNYEKMMRNQKEMGFALILSALIIYMILASLFESFSQPFIILTTVPMAAIGAIMALRITGKPVSMGVLIGGILLLGIVVNNAIILVDRINFLRKKHSLTFNISSIVKQAAGDRLRPVMMTSMTTIASMLFLALDRSESSNLWSPLAITVIGGMSVATLLTLFIVPSLYLIFNDFKKLLSKRRY